MPLFENACDSCEVQFEWLTKAYTDPDPECPRCKGATRRMASSPNVIWSKPLVDYGDRSKEGYSKQQSNGGHWVMGKNGIDGKPYRRFLETPKQQSEYCRQEGLLNPRDMPSNLSIAKDGKSYETVNRSEI